MSGLDLRQIGVKNCGSERSCAAPPCDAAGRLGAAGTAQLDAMAQPGAAGTARLDVLAQPDAGAAQLDVPAQPDAGAAQLDVPAQLDAGPAQLDVLAERAAPGRCDASRRLFVPPRDAGLEPPVNWKPAGHSALPAFDRGGAQRYPPG
jgi:hypothetical protein